MAYWDAYKNGNILNRQDEGISCVGNTRFGQKCRWDIPEPRLKKIRSSLDTIEEKPPSKAAQHLRKLASLGLCQNYHQDQTDEIVKKWKKLLDDATEEFNKPQGLRRKIRILKKKLAEERQINERLSDEALNLTRLLKDKEDNFLDFLNEVDKLHARENLEDTIVQLRADVKQHDTDREEMEVQVKLLQNKLSSYDEGHLISTQCSQDIRHMSSRLEEEHQLSEQLLRDRKELQAESKGFAVDIKTLRDELSIEKTRAGALERRVHDLESTLEELDESDELQEAKLKIQWLDEEGSARLEKLASTQEKLQTKTAICKRLRSELDDTQTQQEELAAKHSVSIHQLAEKHSELHRLRSLLSSLDSDLSEALEVTKSFAYARKEFVYSLAETRILFDLEEHHAAEINKHIIWSVFFRFRTEPIKGQGWRWFPGLRVWRTGRDLAMRPNLRPAFPADEWCRYLQSEELENQIE